MSSHRRIAVLVLGASLSVASAARASFPRSFSAGSLIIPMDLCYQPTSGSGGWSLTGQSCGRRGCSGGTWTLPGGLPSTYCPDPVATPGNGVLRAYGLVYTLLQNKVPVYYVVDGTKTVVSSPDLTITSASQTPVSRVNNSTGATSEFMKSTNFSVAFRGAPFVIDVTNVPAALAIIEADANGTSPMFNQVQIYYAKQNFQAPVAGVLQGPPPLIALNGLDPVNVTILQQYLTDAGLSTNQISYWPTIGTIFTVLGYNNGNGGGYSDYTTSDGLNKGGFKVWWSPHWEGLSSLNNSTTNLDAVLGKISAFGDKGNSIFAECIGMATIEGGTDVNSWAPQQPGRPNGHFLTVPPTNTTIDFKTNYLQPVGGTWPNNSNESFTTPTTEAANPIIQIGDYVFNSVSGYTEDFVVGNSASYVSGIHRLLYTASTSGSDATYVNKDIVVTGNKNGDATKGQVVYLAGHSYDSSMTAGERIPLNTLLVLGQINQTVEMTRSSPVVYSDAAPAAITGKVFLGTYVQQSMPSTSYPPWIGHFRQYPPGSLSGSNVTAFGSLAADWDSANNIKTQSTTDARNIFTAVKVSGKYTQTAFTTANAGTLGVSTTAITGIRTGALGGVDHSIPAIIGPSTLAGSNSRPVVAYFGALDGMLHAVLVSGSISGRALNPGDEIFAFIPPSQLGSVVTYNGGVDGSPSVGDAFIDIGNGTKQWRTLLAITDGTYTGGTIDVLDVTDPGNPKFLWEGSDSFTVSGKTYVLGRAQGAAISKITLPSGGVGFAYFLATDNTNGSAGNAFNMYALDAGTGNVLWRFNHVYPNDTAHNDVPGVVAAVDSAGDDGPADKIFFGDIEGKVWAVPAGTGPAGSQAAIFDAASFYLQPNTINYPIESGLSVYRDSTSQDLDVLGVTGGADWVPSTVASHIFRFDTKTSVGTNLDTLGTGERVYAVPTVSGNSAYVITSLGQLQNQIGNNFAATGNILRIGLGATPTVTTLGQVKQGASEVAVDASGNVIAASVTGITMNGNTGADTTAPVALQNATVKLLTVRAWLDFH
jgi:hypothetical protein